MPGSVTVSIVTFNSRRYIRRCLETLLEQTHRPAAVVVVDNASLDGTRLILGEFRGKIRLIQNERNVGFAAGQNQAIAASRSEWVLTLNPDVLLKPRFLEQLVSAGEQDGKIGTVCGKLLRIGQDFEPMPDRRLDSAGIYFVPNLRHFDRGWNEPDDGRFARPELVFGGSAAAALYRREMIRDVSLTGAFFDPEFFTYREDADVAWRAQLLGWQCLYTPDAMAYHVRRVVPGSRRPNPAVLNMHSVKNRFLMRINNLTGDLFQRHWWPILSRDLLIAGGCLFSEPASLPAFWRLARCLPKAIDKRRQIMRRRRVSDEYLASWFQPEPSAQPVAEYALR